MKKASRLLSALLAVVLVVGAIPVAYAADPDDLSGMREPTKVFTVGTPSTSYSNSYTTYPPVCGATTPS